MFRCDASPDSGSGHVMRCLTLADYFAGNDWTCVFVCSAGTIDTVPLLKEKPYKNYLPDDNFGTTFDIAIIDGYAFSLDDETRLRNHAKTIVALDDLASRAHDCDILIDQTYGRDAKDYELLVPKHCLILTGSDYALLRKQFPQLRESALAARRQRAGRIDNVLITMGGTDPHNVTGRVITALSHISGIKAHVVLNTAMPAYEECMDAAVTRNIFTYENVKDMARLMADADLCVGAGGTSSWERCCLALPCLNIIIADNQKLVSAELSKAGAIINLGEYQFLDANSIESALRELLQSPERILSLANNAAAICDGQGARRVYDLLTSSVTLRPFSAEDEALLLSWQHEPGARDFSRNRELPSKEQHAQWFGSFLIDEKKRGYLIFHEGEPAGYVRFGTVDEKAMSEISIFVNSQKQGMGIAAAALSNLFIIHNKTIFAAFVYPENKPSIRLFQKLGFVEEEAGWYVRRLQKSQGLSS